MYSLKIHNLGPIRDCKIHLERFNVFMGPQASGKSTIAKALFYFLNLPKEVYAQITARPQEGEVRDSLSSALERRLRRRFLQIFGPTRLMSLDMNMEFTYDTDTFIQVYLELDTYAPEHKFLRCKFSENISYLLQKYDERRQYDWPAEHILALVQSLSELFGDAYTQRALYIPAGRSVISVLSDQMPLILDDDGGGRTVDFCTRSYIRHIFELRPSMRDGLEGLRINKKVTTQQMLDEGRLDVFKPLMDDVLRAEYLYRDGEEQLVLPHQQGDDEKKEKYVKLNYASSGQQETVWIFNMLWYWLVEGKRVKLILEEPEAHLYPDSQKRIADVLSLFAGAGNTTIVTTHSPYILGEFNNLLFADTLQGDYDRVKDVVPRELRLDGDSTVAYYVAEGEAREAVNGGLIRSEWMDGASADINDAMDALMEMKWNEEGLV